MKHSKSTSRPTGYGKSLDSASRGMEESLSGRNAGPPGSAGKDRQAEINKPKAVDPDADYPGNVHGTCSKPVKI